MLRKPPVRPLRGPHWPPWTPLPVSGGINQYFHKSALPVRQYAGQRAGHEEAPRKQGLYKSHASLAFSGADNGIRTRGAWLGALKLFAVAEERDATKEFLASVVLGEDPTKSKHSAWGKPLKNAGIV